MITVDDRDDEYQRAKEELEDDGCMPTDDMITERREEIRREQSRREYDK